MTAFSPALRAAMLMTVATAFTALQNVVIRVLSDGGIHPFEIAFFRCLFGFVAVAAVVLWRERAWPRIGALRLVAASSLFHLGAMLGFFYGLSVMPLNDSAALTFAAPLYSTIGAALFLGEKVHARRWIAIVIGFAGVLVVLRPGMIPFTVGAAAVLFSSISFAGVNLLVKRMSGTERATTVVFYQSLFMSFLTIPPAAIVWTTPSLETFLMLAALGALSTIGWLCFTRAFALADASAILPLEFTRLPFVAIFAYLQFGEVPDRWVWIGAAVIFASTLVLTGRESAVERPPAKDRARREEAR